MRMAARRGILPEFPEAVSREVSALERSGWLEDPGLADLRDRPFVTIDDESSKDLDQAVHVRRQKEGWLISYALADAAHFVRPGTALFEEALRRGASYYFPGFSVPMLPRRLSEGIVSLNPGVDRRAMVFEIPIRASAEVGETRVRRAKIRSRAKLSFERVQAHYDAGDSPAGARGSARLEAPIAESLDALREVGLLRISEAQERGVVRYRRAEVKVELGAGGFVVMADLRHAIERYNEQISLLCNVEGARLLREGRRRDAALVQPIYRVHPPPEPDSMRSLERLMAATAAAHALDPRRWVWRAGSGAPLADVLEGMPRQGRAGRIARALHRQAVYTNLRSSFSSRAAGHHGIGAEVYARFSAPMREIVGVFLHEELWESLEGEARPPHPAHSDEALRALVVERANEAKLKQKEIEREAHRLVLDQLFEADLGLARSARARSGTVVGLTGSRLHVLLDEPPIDVKIYLRHLGPSLAPSEAGEALVDPAGVVHFRLGDEVLVHVIERDPRSERWRLACARAPGGA